MLDIRQEVRCFWTIPWFYKDNRYIDIYSILNESPTILQFRVEKVNQQRRILNIMKSNKQQSGLLEGNEQPHMAGSLLP